VERASTLLVFVLPLALFIGCVGKPSQYISPRVTGRVVDEQTRQPIENVEVRRMSGSVRAEKPTKGAEVAMVKPPALTDASGNFILKSEKSLAFFRQLNWYSVNLSFEHAGYTTLVRSYSLRDSTNTPTGEPLVPAGDIPLRRLSK
jgi:hypothetical protein